MGLFSFFALSKASLPHGYQSTGLCACWSRYGDFSWMSRFVCCSSAPRPGSAALTAKANATPHREREQCIVVRCVKSATYSRDHGCNVYFQPGNPINVYHSAKNASRGAPQCASIEHAISVVSTTISLVRHEIAAQTERARVATEA